MPGQISPSPGDPRLKETLALFGQRVKTSRLRLGISQEVAAKRAGVSQSNWSKVERGAVDPSLGLVLRIQMALNAASIENFFGPFPSSCAAHGERGD